MASLFLSVKTLSDPEFQISRILPPPLQFSTGVVSVDIRQRHPDDDSNTRDNRSPAKPPLALAITRRVALRPCISWQRR